MKKLQGYVAFIDVLGFRNLIARDQSLLEIESYVNTVATVADRKEGNHQLQYVLFSDSIVLNTTDLDLRSFELLLMACSELFHDLLHRELPVRGGIACGTFLRSDGEKGSIVAGAPILEAIQLEQAQDWAGIAVGTSVLRRLPELRKQCELPGNLNSEDDAKALQSRLDLARCLSEASIPMHTTHPLDTQMWRALAVLPLPRSARSPGAIARSLQETVAAARRLHELAPDPRSQKKCGALMNHIAMAAGPWGSYVHHAFMLSRAGREFEW